MKRNMSALFTLAVAALLICVPGASALSCSNATLTGNYGFFFTGFGSPGHSLKANEVPFDGVGVGAFDGAGNFSATFTDSFNGGVGTNNPYTATYILNSDCTGSMTSTNGDANFSLVAVSGGTEVLAFVTDFGSTLTMDMKQAPSACSNATLNGNYGFTFSGFAAPAHSTKGNEVPFAGAGMLSFDGAGNTSGNYNDSFNGRVGTNSPYAATYTVNPDCSGVVIGAPGGNADGAIAIVGGGAEVLFIQTDAGGTWGVDMKKQ